MSDENQSSDSGSPPSKRKSLTKSTCKRKVPLRSSPLLSEQMLASSSQESAPEPPTEKRAFADVSGTVPPRPDQPANFTQQPANSKESSALERAEEIPKSQEDGASVEEKQKEEKEVAELREKEEKAEKEERESEKEKDVQLKEKVEEKEQKVELKTEEAQQLVPEAESEGDKLEPTETVEVQSGSKLESNSPVEVTPKDENEEESDAPRSTDSEGNKLLETESSSTSEEFPTKSKRLKIEEEETPTEPGKSSDDGQSQKCGSDTSSRDLSKPGTSAEVVKPPNVHTSTVLPTPTTRTTLSVAVTKAASSVARAELKKMLKASGMSIVPPNRTIGPEFGRDEALSDIAKALASAAARSTLPEESVAPPNITIGPNFDKTLSVLVPRNVADVSKVPKDISRMRDNIVPPNRTVGRETSLGVTVPVIVQEPPASRCRVGKMSPSRTAGCEITSSSSSSGGDGKTIKTKAVPGTSRMTSIHEEVASARTIVTGTECVIGTSEDEVALSKTTKQDKSRLKIQPDSHPSTSKTTPSTAPDTTLTKTLGKAPISKVRGRSRLIDTYVSVRDQVIPPNEIATPGQGFTGKRPKAPKTKNTLSLSVEVPLVTTMASKKVPNVPSTSKVVSSTSKKTGEDKTVKKSVLRAALNRTAQGSTKTDGNASKEVKEAEPVFSTSSTSSGEVVSGKTTVTIHEVKSELVQYSPTTESGVGLSGSTSSGEVVSGKTTVTIHEVKSELVQDSPSTESGVGLSGSTSSGEVVSGKTTVTIHEVKSELVQDSPSTESGVGLSGSTSSGEVVSGKTTVTIHEVKSELVQDSPSTESEVGLSGSSTIRSEVTVHEPPVPVTTSSSTATVPATVTSTQPEDPQELLLIEEEFLFLSSSSSSSGEELPAKTSTAVQVGSPLVSTSGEATLLEPPITTANLSATLATPSISLQIEGTQELLSVISDFILNSSGTSSGEGLLVKPTITSRVVSPLGSTTSGELTLPEPPASSGSNVTLPLTTGPSEGSREAPLMKSEFHFSGSSTSSGEGLLVRPTFTPQTISPLVSAEAKRVQIPPLDENEFALSSSSATSEEMPSLEPVVTSSCVKATPPVTTPGEFLSIKSEFNLSSSSTSSGERLLVRPTCASQVVSAESTLARHPSLVEKEIVLSSSSTTSSVTTSAPVSAEQKLPHVETEIVTSEAGTSGDGEVPTKRTVSFAGIIPKTSEVVESTTTTSVSVTSPVTATTSTQFEELSPYEVPLPLSSGSSSSDSRGRLPDSTVGPGFEESSSVEAELSPQPISPDDGNGEGSDSNLN